MPPMDIAALSDLIEVARGRKPADLCLRNARIVNVCTGDVQTGHLGVHRGRLVGWGDYRGREEVDLLGAYVAPGFIDGHLHLESTLLSPREFAKAVLPHGTTAVVLDPHEIANVLGLEGVRALIEASEGLPVDFFFMLPSCVPASPMDPAGALLRGADLHTLRGHPRVLGLAEMMNVPGVLHGDPSVLEKIVLFQDTILDGHCPGLSGEELNAYLSCGIFSDHETTTLDEALEKLSKGMTLMIREGSQSKDLAALIGAVTDATWPQCLLVSDDRHPTDLLHDGHMDSVVNRATALGLHPVRALALASWTAARAFGLRGRGAVAPGYAADLSVSSILMPWKPILVFKNGRCVVRDGVLCLPEEASQEALLESLPSPMAVSRVDPSTLRVVAQGSRVRVIGVREGSLITEHLILPATIRDDAAVCDPERDVLKIVVFTATTRGKDPLGRRWASFEDSGFGKEPWRVRWPMIPTTSSPSGHPMKPSSMRFGRLWTVAAA